MGLTKLSLCCLSLLTASVLCQEAPPDPPADVDLSLFLSPPKLPNPIPPGCNCHYNYEPVCGTDGKTYSNRCVLTCQNAGRISGGLGGRRPASPGSPPAVGFSAVSGGKPCRLQDTGFRGTPFPLPTGKIDKSGHSYALKTKVTGCIALCQNTPKCQVWSYNSRSLRCYIRASDEGTRVQVGTISGRKRDCGPHSTGNTPDGPVGYLSPQRIQCQLTDTEFSGTPFDLQTGNTDSNGHSYDIRDSVRDCMILCQNTPECMVWTYIPHDFQQIGRCYVRTKETTTVVEKGAISGRKRDCGADSLGRVPDQPFVGFAAASVGYTSEPIKPTCRLRDTNFRGTPFDLQTGKTDEFGHSYAVRRTVGDCIIMCQNTPECVAWTYIPHDFQQTGRCYVRKTDEGTYFQENAISGRKSDCFGKSTGEERRKCRLHHTNFGTYPFDLQTGQTDEYGHSYAVRTTDFDCIILCQNTPECVAWTYIPHPFQQTGRCYVRTSDKGRYYEDGSVSGLKADCADPSPSAGGLGGAFANEPVIYSSPQKPTCRLHDTTFEGTPFDLQTGNTDESKHSYAIRHNVTDCIILCQNTPECMVWTFVLPTTNFTDSVNGRCYVRRRDNGTKYQAGTISGRKADCGADSEGSIPDGPVGFSAPGSVGFAAVGSVGYTSEPRIVCRLEDTDFIGTPFDLQTGHTDVFGQSYAPSKSVNDCIILCQNTPECAVWTFLGPDLSRSGRCYVRTSDLGTYYQEATVSGRKRDCGSGFRGNIELPPFELPDRTCRLKNTGIDGTPFDLQTGTVDASGNSYAVRSTVSDCIILCQNTPECRVWSFIESDRPGNNNRCYIKTSDEGIYYQPRTTSGRRTACNGAEERRECRLSDRGFRGTPFDLQTGNTDSFGHSFAVRSTVTECIILCQNTPECMVWTYMSAPTPQVSRCYVRTSDDGDFYTPGAVSGRKVDCAGNPRRHCLKNGCNKLYRPVCGSDGVTYSNKCLLDLANCETGGGISVQRNGACQDGGRPSKPCRLPNTNFGGTPFDLQTGYTDIHNHSYAQLQNVTMCFQLCQNTPECMLWTFVTPKFGKSLTSGRCYVRTSDDEHSYYDAGTISGRKRDCTHDKMTAEVGPCYPGLCGRNAECHAVGDSAVCTCLNGFTGDPYLLCSGNFGPPPARPVGGLAGGLRSPPPVDGLGSGSVGFSAPSVGFSAASAGFSSNSVGYTSPQKVECQLPGTDFKGKPFDLQTGNTDFWGHSYAFRFTVEECILLCQNTPECVVWTYIPSDSVRTTHLNRCYVRTSDEGSVYKRGTISGYKRDCYDRSSDKIGIQHDGECYTACVDNSKYCSWWADQGYCTNFKYIDYMTKTCPNSCQTCRVG